MVFHQRENFTRTSGRARGTGIIASVVKPACLVRILQNSWSWPCSQSLLYGTDMYGSHTKIGTGRERGVQHEIPHRNYILAPRKLERLDKRKTIPTKLTVPEHITRYFKRVKARWDGRVIWKKEGVNRTRNPSSPPNRTRRI